MIDERSVGDIGKRCAARCGVTDDKSRKDAVANNLTPRRKVHVGWLAAMRVRGTCALCGKYQICTDRKL